MNTVEPIRDREVLVEISEYLKENNERNYIMFLIGIFCGLRISDILKLRVIDVKNKDIIKIRSQKTNQEIKHPIPPFLKKELSEYYKGKKLDEYLIKSRVGVNKPIRREWAYEIFRDIGELFGLDSLGTHTLRKTFGYTFYEDNPDDIATLQIILGHTNQRDTLIYIGKEQEHINRKLKNHNPLRKKR